MNPSAPVAHQPLLRVRNLATHYVDKLGVTIRAVDGVSFDLAHGEVVGVVGESGCGKTTLGRTLMRLIPPTSGRILVDGEDFLAKRGAALKAARRNIQMVFQDPFGSLNPRHSVGAIIGEPLQVHGIAGGSRRVRELLELVGLPPDAGGRYPHEFSGGQRQRIAIARALALQPRLVIADEPVSALDVSIQAQIINLLADLRAQFGLSMIFIGHDLSVIRHVSDRIAVMYFGKIVEIGPSEQILKNPSHPYTQALVAAVPRPPGTTLGDTGRSRLLPLIDEVPNPANPPRGCAFKARCPAATEQCGEAIPELLPQQDSEQPRSVACFNV
jgi:oligopeptide/dipeptide ABC transporter ATP-binding protein